MKNKKKDPGLNQGWKEPLPEAHGPPNETNKIYCTVICLLGLS